MNLSETYAVFRKSPWFMGLAVGGGMGALSLATSVGPLPLKLGGAVMAASFAAFRSARRRGRRKLLQPRLPVEEFRQPDVDAAEMPAGEDFRAQLARRSTRLAPPVPPPPVATVGPATATTALSDIDRRCAALERDVGSAGRMF